MPVYVLELTLSIPSEIRFQSFSGYAVRGFFFKLLEGADPGYAEKLHSSKGVAPYSLSPLEVRLNRGWKPVYQRVKGPALASIRMVLLNRELMERVKDAILRGSLSAVDLMGTVCDVHEISFSEIPFRRFLESAGAYRRFSVDFRTPCYFRRKPRVWGLLKSLWRSSGGEVKKVLSMILEAERMRRKDVSIAHPLPDPLSMFSSLANVWREYSDVGVDFSGFLDWVDEGGIVISGFPEGIRTQRLFEHRAVREKWQVGFVGKVRFSTLDELYDEKHAKLADALLRFGELVNVGANRTAGFGRMEYSPARE